MPLVNMPQGKRNPFLSLGKPVYLALQSPPRPQPVDFSEFTNMHPAPSPNFPTKKPRA